MFSTSHLLYVRLDMWLLQDGVAPHFKVGESYRLVLELQPSAPILPTDQDRDGIQLARAPKEPVDPGPYYDVVGAVSWRQGEGMNVAAISVDQLYLGLDDPSLSPTWERVAVLGTVAVAYPPLSAARAEFPEVETFCNVGRIIGEFAPFLATLPDDSQDPRDWSRYRSRDVRRAEPWPEGSLDPELVRYLLGVWFPDDGAVKGP